MKPWQEWCGNWNRYTRRRLDAGNPILQRILTERQKSTWLTTPSGPSAISTDGGKTWEQTVTLIPPPTSAHNKAGSIKGLAAAKSAQAGSDWETAKGPHGARQNRSEGTFGSQGDSFYRRVLGFIGRTFRRGDNRGRG